MHTNHLKIWLKHRFWFSKLNQGLRCYTHLRWCQYSWLWYVLYHGSRELGLVKKWSRDLGDVSLIIKFPIHSASDRFSIYSDDHLPRSVVLKARSLNLQLWHYWSNLLKILILGPHPRSNKSENLERKQQSVLRSSSDHSDICLKSENWHMISLGLQWLSNPTLLL